MLPQYFLCEKCTHYLRNILKYERKIIIYKITVLYEINERFYISLENFHEFKDLKNPNPDDMNNLEIGMKQK